MVCALQALMAADTFCSFLEQLRHAAPALPETHLPTLAAFARLAVDMQPAEGVVPPPGRSSSSASLSKAGAPAAAPAEGAAPAGSTPVTPGGGKGPARPLGLAAALYCLGASLGFH